MHVGDVLIETMMLNFAWRHLLDYFFNTQKIRLLGQLRLGESQDFPNDLLLLSKKAIHGARPGYSSMHDARQTHVHDSRQRKFRMIDAWYVKNAIHACTN